jgi:hypothetical protein
MIRKDEFDCYEIICDECGEHADADFDTFRDAVDYKKSTAKEEGWRAVKDKDGCRHDLCPGCATPDFIKKLTEGV